MSFLAHIIDEPIYSEVKSDEAEEEGEEITQDDAQKGQLSA